jgi:RNA 2',3'-cyclic 3'-phosphodiesterase
MADHERVGRLFLAVDLSDRAREALVAFVERALAGKPIPGRAPKPQHWHLTLRFLGEVDKIQYGSLVEALQKEPLGSGFEIRFGHLGAFPKPSQAAVFWIGVDQGHQPLCDLARSVERAVLRAGFEPADKPFAPHLTISRIRPPQKLEKLILGAGKADIPLRIEQVTLFRSHLGGSGTWYETMESFALSRV